MKFLCPNCKAKYQIADEKVAGRTLKMDCRRCGHSIVLKGDQPPDDAVADAPAARPVPGSPAPGSSPSTARPAPAASGRSGSGLLQPNAARRGATATGRSGSHVGPAPSRPAVAAPRSALGADFRRSVGSTGSLTPEAPRTTPLDQWHVAINDVPVGPMRRDEISRKIATGAVTAESLAWREGFDDWRPLRDIPELAALLRKSEALRPGAPPPKTALPGAARPGAPAARPATATGSRPGTARPASTPGTAAAARATGTPAGRGNVVPIGGRLGASAAPALDDDGLDELDSEPTRVASALDLPAEIAAPAPSARPKSTPPPAASELDELDELPDPFPSAAAAPAPAPTPQPAPSPFAAAPAASVASSSPALKSSPAVVPVPEPTRERERKGLPVGAWIAIAGAMSFGIAMAVMIAPRLLPAAPAAPAATATTSPAAAVPQEAPREAPVEVPEAPTEPATPPPEQPAATPEQPAAETPRTGTGSARRPAASTTTTGTGAQTATKSADTSGAFARFADEGTGTGPAPIAPRPQTGSTGGSAGAGSGDGLEPAQVRAVVAREQRGLQSCWELAIRGMREVPTTRMDVDITIGESGTVTRATARGVGVGNLGECIERNVRRWRFPSSGGTTQMSFPVVFQGV